MLFCSCRLDKWSISKIRWGGWESRWIFPMLHLSSLQEQNNYLWNEKLMQLTVLNSVASVQIILSGNINRIIMSKLWLCNIDFRYNDQVKFTDEDGEQKIGHLLEKEGHTYVHVVSKQPKSKRTFDVLKPKIIQGAFKWLGLPPLKPPGSQQFFWCLFSKIVQVTAIFLVFILQNFDLRYQYSMTLGAIFVENSLFPCLRTPKLPRANIFRSIFRHILSISYGKSTW